MWQLQAHIQTELHIPMIKSTKLGYFVQQKVGHINGRVTMVDKVF